MRVRARACVFQVLELMPRALSREVQLQGNTRVLRRCPLFLGCDKGVTKMLGSLMRVAVFLREETLYSTGDLQREVRAWLACMYSVHTPRVAVCAHAMLTFPSRSHAYVLPVTTDSSSSLIAGW